VGQPHDLWRARGVLSRDCEYNPKERGDFTTRDDPGVSTIEKCEGRVQDWEALAESARKDLQGFWAERASELFWFKKWDKVLDDSKKPFFKWFDRRKGQHRLQLYRCSPANLPQEQTGPDLGSRGRQKRPHLFVLLLNREVCRMANIIKAMGVEKGDRVTIYMGRIPEIVFAMLACAKIGAIHSVVFGGFSVDALHERISDSESKLIITCDGSCRTANWSNSSASWTNPCATARPLKT
jgi:acetyl-CoA synthetase